MQIEAGCSGLTIAACHLATMNRHGVLSREAYSAKSSYVNAPSSSAMTQAYVHAVEALHDAAPNLGGGLAFDAYGGAVNRVVGDETAFVHRDKLACIQATSSWSSSSTTNVFTPETGAYQNYIDPTLADWRHAYYGSNLERLVKVKRKYDPDNRFSFAQSIPLSL